MDAIERLKENAKNCSNPLKSIKAFCADCIGTIRTGSGCDHALCPLFDFREGKNPRRKKAALSEERRMELASRLENSPASKSRENGSRIHSIH